MTDCALCGEGIDRRDGTAVREVTGWVRSRKGGGIHHLASPRDTGRWAHGTCVELDRRGGEQLDLFDGP